MHTQTWTCYISESLGTSAAECDEGGEKKNLIKKDKVRGEDCSLNVGCSGRCVAGGCVCFGDESESELRRLN